MTTSNVIVWSLTLIFLIVVFCGLCVFILWIINISIDSLIDIKDKISGKYWFR